MADYARLLDDYCELYLLSSRLYEDFAKRYDETTYSLFALLFLREHPQGATQRDLREYLCVPKQTASTIVASLARRGLLEQRNAADDGRSKELVLTDAGARRCSELHAKLKNIELASFRQLPAADLRQMNDTNRRILEAFSERLTKGA